MNLLEAIGSVTGIIFILLFAGLMVLFFFIGRGHTLRNLREIPAFIRLRRSVGLAVEAGTRVHVSLGRGGLQRFARWFCPGWVNGSRSNFTGCLVQ